MKDFGAFNKNLTIPYFLRSFDAAVKVGGTWRFADPGSSLLPFGMLDWREQGQAALIADPRQPQLVVTPIAEPGASLTRREGRFKLSASGDLAGEVRLVYRGHSAWRRRYSYRRASPSEREEAVRKTVTDRHRSATVEQISIDGLLGSEELTIGYRVKIPGYAERTGRRLFLQCALFNRNLTPRYPSGGARTHPIAYENAWSEEDDFTFELPAGYAFESPDAPAGIKIGDFGDYRARFTVSPDLRTLRYERMFEFGRGGRLTFPVEAYSALKRVFDQVQEADNHSLALRQEAP
jgi:hypothetical protein